MAKILLIEDEPWMGELYVQLLSREHKVVWRRDGYDALEAIEADRPDLVVLDLLLPWANGLQLLHELASYQDTARLPVVLFSAALPSEVDDETLRAYGVVAALDKAAVKPAQVLATVNEVLVVHATAS